ncbi:MAG TPA: putative DNA-binding domain-containing protein, partial [Thermoanaerobaculia bacterium]|nr:putative DNA-binding domain-containing protein [Thermoanaerobaculia bacterium]
ARLLEVLEAEYPAVRFVLGAEAFGSLASRHLATFPPSTFDLAHVGRHLPAYIAADPLAEDLPFLPDLATLERAVSEAFVAADSEPVRLERVLALGARAAGEVSVRLSPGTALVRSIWPIHQVWKARLWNPEDVGVELEAGKEALLVHRPGERVLVTKVDEETARLVDTFRDGRSIADALDGLIDPARPARAEIARLVAAFRRLVDIQVLTEASG